MKPEHVAFLNTLTLPAAIVTAACVLGFSYVIGKVFGGKS